MGVRDILAQLEEAPTSLKTEIIFRALGQIVRQTTLSVWRIGQLIDRLEEKEKHLTQLINRMEQLGWETAIRNEMERREREGERTQRTLKRRRFNAKKTGLLQNPRR